MDILFIKPGSQRKLYGALSDHDLTGIEPPMWAGLLAAHTRARGFETGLIDAEVEEWTYEEAAREILARKPKLAVIAVSGTNPSASTMNMTGAGLIARKVRELSADQKICLHGIHPSALPEQTLKDELAVNFICRGEGFLTFPALIEALTSVSPLLSKVPGLYYRDEEGQVRQGPVAVNWPDLDELSAPAWDLLPMAKYRAHHWHCFSDLKHRQPYGVLMTSLGCPYKCSFCCINSIFGKPGLRQRSPEKVVDDIGIMVEQFGVRNIKIMDELFAINENRIESISKGIRDRGYDVNMWAYARVNTVSRRMLDNMRLCGIEWAAYGFEAANDRVLKDVHKGYDADETLRIVDETRRAGMYIVSNFIFGLPEDDLQSMEQTFRLAQEINGEWGNLYVTMAYPGSALYDQAVAEGWALPDSWQGYSQYSYETLPLRTKYLTAGEVLKFRDEAFIRYYRDSRYQDMIKAVFGDEALRAVTEMLKVKLKRKYIAE